MNILRFIAATSIQGTAMAPWRTQQKMILNNFYIATGAIHSFLNFVWKENLLH